MPATKHCLVQRPYQTLVLGQQAAGRAPILSNGQPTQVQLQLQTFANQAHELDVWPWEEYWLYCKWCGQADTQINWVIEIALPEQINAAG